MVNKKLSKDEILGGFRVVFMQYFDDLKDFKYIEYLLGYFM